MLDYCGVESQTGHQANKAKPQDSCSLVTSLRKCGDIPTGFVVDIPLSEINFGDDQWAFRASLKVADLREDLKANGQQIPVFLRTVKKPKKKTYQIVSGFRRCWAARELGWVSIKAIIRDDLDDSRACQVSFLENEKRRNFTSLDRAHAIAKMVLQGHSCQEIQRLSGIGERQFYRYKKAAEFRPEVREAIEDNFITITQGLVLTQAFQKYGNAVDLHEWIDWVMEEKASVRKLKSTLAARFGNGIASKSGYLNQTQSGGFKMKQMVFEPQTAREDVVQQMMAQLRDALDLLKQWAENER